MLPVPVNVNVSFLLPPVRFAIPINALAPFASVNVPAFGAVIAHVLATSPPASTGPPVTHTPAASPAPHPARHPGSDPPPGGAP